MAKFSELGVTTDVVVGKGIEIEDLFGRRILIEKTIIAESKFPAKNQSGLRMQMQVCLSEWEEDGTFKTDIHGQPDGQRRSCFTGSDILIGSIQRAEEIIAEKNNNRSAGSPEISLYPMETIIVKVGKGFQFT